MRAEIASGVLSNCYAYVRNIYPSLPNTAHILTHLSEVGEVGVLYYPKSGLYHYVVVEVDGDVVTFSETNYHENTFSRRSLPRSAFVAFYKL